MDLRAKLGRLRIASAPAAAVSCEPEIDRPKAERIAQLRALIGEVAARDRLRDVTSRVGLAGGERDVAAENETRHGTRGVADNAVRRSTRVATPTHTRGLPFCEIPTQHGIVHVLERWLEPDHHHGRAAVRDGLRHAPGTLAMLARDASLSDLDLSRALFLDTETTGLAGGTGTVAFLIGLARFVDGVLCVEQLIVPELGHERPALARLAERIAAASCIITYNGKSFDWPLLRTRYVLSRMPIPALASHIDLLHASRAVWKRRMPSVRLTDIEREILGFERLDDIPGSEIPARYFAYLRDGAAERLTPILEHNQNDVIALAALLGALITRFEQTDKVADPRDALAFGRIALRARDSERALLWAEAALAASGGDECGTPPLHRRSAREALLLAGEVQRQRGDAMRAAELLERALLHSAEPPLRAAVHFALAKLYEHEQGALTAALRHARHTEPIEGPHAHGRRLGRLHRRLLRGQAGPGSPS